MNATTCLAFCVACLLFLPGCEADLGSSSAPLHTNQENKVVVFGHYAGVYQEGSAGEERPISLESESCGEIISGTMTGLFDEEISLQGSLVGTALYLEGNSSAQDGYTIVLTGFVPENETGQNSASYISGFWEGAGESGTWIVEWSSSTSPDEICEPGTESEP